jgi:prepilin peptidase CpaA
MTLPMFFVLLQDAARENPLTAVVCVWVCAAAILDLIRHRISNLLTVGGLVLALAMRFAGQGWEGLVDGLIGFAVGFGIYLPLYAIGWMGGGDVKLMGAAGGFLGWPDALFALALTTLIGVIVALLIIGINGGLKEYLTRYGLMLKCLFFTGQFQYVAPQPGSVATKRYPYAFTIALGTLGALGWAGQLTPFLRVFGG